MTRARGLWRALLTLAVTLTLAVLLALTLGALSYATGEARTGDDFAWDGILGPGKTLRIQGVNGAIRATRAEGDRAEVTAEKTARRSDPDLVRIEVHAHEGGVTICALYPDKKGRPAGDCGPDGGSSSHVHNNDVVVDFEVRVPAGVRLVAATVNGSVNGVGLDSDVELTAVNGSIRVDTRRSAEATTVNGSIHAAMGSRAGFDDLEFTTVNGSIELELPRTVDADLRASTVNGRVSANFPVVVSSGDFTRRNLRARIGDGGPDLRLTTVNGSIRLTAAR